MESAGPIQPAQQNPSRERNWAMACHLTALSLFIGLPFGNLIVPFILWLIKKNEMPLVDVNGKESLNFQISMTIYLLSSAFLCFFFIGFLFLFPLIITDFICVIIAAVKTSNGEPYQYPITIRFLK
jgi:uncharacterized protein